MTKINPKMFKLALKDTGGIYQQIAKNLKVCRNAVVKYVSKHPETKALIEEERERILDLMEASLIKKAIVNDDFKAQQFYLKTIGKDRGYVEKTETELSGSTDNRITFEIVNPMQEKPSQEIAYKEPTPTLPMETKSIELNIEEKPKSPSGQSSKGNESH